MHVLEHMYKPQDPSKCSQIEKHTTPESRWDWSHRGLARSETWDKTKSAAARKTAFACAKYTLWRQAVLFFFFGLFWRSFRLIFVSANSRTCWEWAPSNGEPDLSRKQPYILGKEPYISRTETHISRKEPCISFKEPYISWKSPRSHENSPTSHEKCPRSHLRAPYIIKRATTQSPLTLGTRRSMYFTYK